MGNCACDAWCANGGRGWYFYGVVALGLDLRVKEHDVQVHLQQKGFHRTKKKDYGAQESRRCGEVILPLLHLYHPHPHHHHNHHKEQKHAHSRIHRKRLPEEAERRRMCSDDATGSQGRGERLINGVRRGAQKAWNFREEQHV